MTLAPPRRPASPGRIAPQRAAPARAFARRSACLCLVALAWPLGGSATTEVAVQVGKTVQTVDNPFFLPDSSNSPLKVRDTVDSTDLGVAVRVPMPSDRSFLAVAANASQQRYGTLSQLDYTARQLDATYQWEYASILRGRLRHRYDERLYSYYGGFFTNPETPRATQDLVEVALRITPQLDLPVTVSRGSLNYNDASLAQRYDSEDRTLQLALTYTSGRRSIFTAGVRRTDVNFPNRSAVDVASIDSGYSDQEAFVDVSWRYTDDTVLFGRVGRLDRSFNSLAARDTQLVSISSGVEWRHSPKTFLSLRGYRQPQSNDQADLRLYVVSTGLEARVLYDMTYKTRFALTTAYEQQAYQNFTNTTASSLGGKDRVLRVSARVEYRPTSRTLLRVEGLRERIQPDPTVSTTGEFNRNSLQLGLSYTFENMQGANRARTQLEAMRYDRIR
ncbi:hypothetical protein GN316_16760 [Xylophilus sp. Kf1]|nr:hypothetical protein [Xylophilus sp. Kf1]